MFRTSFLSALLLALLWTTLAGAGEPRKLTAAEEPSTALQGTVPPGAALQGNAVAGPAAATGDTWRYRQHRGTWWYWLPSEKWVYWSGGQWVPYDAARFAQTRNQSAGRSYSYRTDRQYGAWGPVRYDRFGQPQYPYSRRRTGVRQLGAVPAYGGVRALPGWGGER